MNTPWTKVATNFWSNPKVVDAGWPAREMFLYLLARNREGGYDGRLPRRALFSTAINQALGIDSAQHVRGVEALEACELVCVEADGVSIVGWDEEWRAAKTEAERKRRERARKKTRVTKCHGPSVTMSRNVTPREEEKREEKRRTPPIRPPGGGAADVTVDLVSAFNRGFDRQLGAKGFRKSVARALREGYRAEELKGVVWWAVRQWGDDPDFRMRISPQTLFKLTSAAGNRTLPEYLELASERWVEEHEGQQPPWKRNGVTHEATDDENAHGGNGAVCALQETKPDHPVHPGRGSTDEPHAESSGDTAGDKV